MTPKEFLLDETRRWLSKALADLRAARLSIDHDLEEVAVYHCQKASEKTLKGFLVFQQQTFRNTHDLKELGQACLVFDPSLSSKVEVSFRLTEYAWIFRYPGGPRDIDEGEAETAFEIAGRLYEGVIERLASATDDEG